MSTTQTVTETHSQIDGPPTRLYVPGLECGPYGQRLCVQVADELARKTPDRIYATVTTSLSDISLGFRDITIRQFCNAVNCAAWDIETKFGKSENFDVIAYIGLSDVRYGIYLYAAIKTGHQLMIPSIRNSASQDVAVFEEASCSRVIYTPNFVSKIRSVKSERPDLLEHEAISLENLIGSQSKHYEYNKTWTEARTDPIVIAHSSGSTGTPKPTTITHGVYSTYDNHRKLPTIAGRKIQGYTLLEFEGGGKFYNPFPPFHLAGLFAMTIMPIFYNCTVTTGPPEKPPSGELLSQAMNMLKIRAGWCPPTVIEQLLEQPGGFEQAASLDWIMYTGGPLAKSVGDRLSKVTDVCQMYGSTETGPHVTLVPLSENWQWFEWHPMLENAMEDQGDGTFEMVVYKDSSLDWIRHLSQAYPHLDVWKTNDLFIQHPTNPKLWRFHGRKDDVLVLSNGEKFNPVYMENAIVGHSLVRGALIVGTGRFQASLILEPKPDITLSNAKLIEEVWPTIQEANNLGPAHGRIFKHKIVVGTPDKPFKRAGKGTVIRGQTVKLYAEEVESLYVEDQSQELESSCTSKDLDALKDCVRSCVSRVAAEEFSDTDDLFVLGMDSLQTMELTKSLNKRFAQQLERLAQGNILAGDLYNHSSVQLFSEHLHKAFSNQKRLHEAKASDRIATMNQLIEKYSAGLRPQTSTSAPKSRGSLCVAVTGSTGSLGQQLLRNILQDPKIGKVYCLNRAPDARERHVASLQSLGLNIIHDLYRKAEFLTTNFDDPKFGLTAEAFSDLGQNVDAIIHNAWKVNFNHDLSSFEDVHIRGVRNLIDFSLASERQAHILFVSSLSSVGNWPELHTTEVPEMPILDSNVAMKMGYGESKHVAERILHNAAVNAGVKSTILRVGQLAGPLSRDGGMWNRTEWFPQLMKTSKTLGMLPDMMGTIDWIPVDEMAKMITDLLHETCESQSYSVYNLANPRAAEWIWLIPAIVEAWGAKGTSIVPFAHWLDVLANKSGTAEDLDKYPAIKILDFYRGLAEETQVPRRERIKYEVKRAASCSKTMANLSPINREAMETWLSQWDL